MRPTLPASFLSRWLHPTTLLAVLLAVALAVGCWSAANRPVPMPDVAGRIGGMAFSPFQRGQNPEADRWPNEAQISADLALVAQQTGRLRVYSVQGTYAAIPRLAAGLPLRITLGAWLDRQTDRNTAEIERLIATARDASNVDRLLVGNETLLRGDQTPDQLIAAMQHVRHATGLPVSTAEPYDIWLKHPELAHAADFLTIHLFPYWIGVAEQDGLQVALDQYAQVRRAYPNKHILIGEIGWPSNGVTKGNATASLVNQAAFMRGFFNAAAQQHLDYFALEAFDQPWKTAFEGRAAGYWGMMDLDRHAKFALTGPISEHPGWLGWALPSALLAALAAWAMLAQRPDLRTAGKLVFAALLQGFAGALAVLLMAMAGTYLSALAATVWGVLAAGQLLLVLLLVADSFELAETVFGGVGRRVPQIVPAVWGDALPKVSIHLPICNEPPHMVRQTLDALAALDYPDFEVLVIDNNTADPALWGPVAEHCDRLGARFRFFHLERWPGFKAGALNFARTQTAPDAAVVGVLDSDYIVSPDWLRCMVPHFANPRVGFVQSPQDYRDERESRFKRLMFWEYAGFFQLGMVTRNERNAIIQHGTMTLVRRTALDAVDGWAEWTICEDAELGLRLFRGGWEAVYSAQSYGRGVMPDDYAAFRKQRFRWAYGAMQICRGHWRALLSPGRSDLSLGQRWHFVTGWLPWVGDALGLLFLGLGLVWSGLLMLAPDRFEFPIVLFMLPSLVLFGFKLVQIFALYASRVRCGWADRVGAAVAGLALSHTIGKAVWKALLVPRAPFLRTPKMADAPALIQGLLMAREEAVLLALTWAAMIGVGWSQHMATLEVRLWCAVLLAQSLPYLASVSVSLLAAMPTRAARVPVPRPAVATSGAAQVA